MANNYTDTADALVLIDSLGKNLPCMYNTDKQSFSGCTIGSLNHKITSGQIYINHYKYIIILIGTNDLAPKDIWSFYKSQRRQGKSGANLPAHNPTAIPVLESLYLQLIATIQQRNHNCYLAFLGLLPRPYDHHRNKDHHVDTNRKLKNICVDKNITFVPTHNSFLKYGLPIEDLFCDGIHLSPKGTIQLHEIISNTINGFRSHFKQSQQ